MFSLPRRFRGHLTQRPMHRFVLLGQLVCALLAHLCFTNAQTVVPDCAVLRTFGMQLNIATTQADWCCQQQATPYITCNTAQPPRVTNIAIKSKQIEGVLPEDIGDLTELVELDVRFNRLSGSIPERIGNLLNLTKLVLYSNRFGIVL